MKFLADTFNPVLKAFDRLGSTGLLVALSLLVVIALFLVPLPPALLDILLVLNIVVALVLLLRGLFSENPVTLYAFPTILLMTTLFRLALNVSSTRLILLGGKESLSAAGSVIESFGTFVVKGNFGVGAIIFAVIAIVNFLVIAKGSSRVAEVSARFALDSLPGRQLAIDSDLRAQNISREEAELRRENLRRESQFFGSMDGSMKFVQGDAIAGFVITFINLVGGVAIGLHAGMSFEDAINSFGILTIGDGLVGIIPSLLISVCAGIIVTHVSGGEGKSSGNQIFSQIVGDPGALVIGGLVLFLLGVIPGFPFIPFALVGIATILLGSVFFRFSLREGSESGQRVQLTSGAASPFPAAAGFSSRGALPEPVSALDYFKLKPLDLGLSESNARGLGFFNKEEFYRYFNLLRDQIYKTQGILVPEVSLSENRFLEDRNFQITLREVHARSIDIDPELLFVPVGKGQLNSFGANVSKGVSHPVNLSGSSWINDDSSLVESLHKIGVGAINSSQYLALEVIGSALADLDAIFGLSETARLVEIFKDSEPRLIEEVFESEVLSISEFSEMLKKLAKENLPIRDLKVLLEGVLEYHSVSSVEENRQDWIQGLHNHLRLIIVRSKLGGQLVVDGDLKVFGLAPEVEEEFKSAVSMWDGQRSRLPLDPEVAKGMRQSSSKLFGPVLERGMVPVNLICPGEIRPAVHQYFSGQFGSPTWLRTLAFEEIDSHLNPQLIGVVGSQ